MRLLAMDIGAGTQDILLFDSSERAENWVHLILPSPTVIVAGQIEAATRRGEGVVLTGEAMGGGADTAALREHLEAGLPAYATPKAALTFDDDPDRVREWGVRIVSEGEARRLGGVWVQMGDLRLKAILAALKAVGVSPQIDALAVAVLDHGAAPKGVSDRLFRFQHLQHEVEKKRELTALPYLREEVPPYLTRMGAAAAAVPPSLPLLLCDSGVAAALGAGLDPRVAPHPHRLSANLGNMHTLCFHLQGERILGLLEHHTSLLTPRRLRGYIEGLARGELDSEQIWEEGGHGGFILERGEGRPFLAATGPRRELVVRCRLRAYLAAPFGDMMLTGCYGLVRAVAHRMPLWREEIEGGLYRRLGL